MQRPSATEQENSTVNVSKISHFGSKYAIFDTVFWTYIM